MEIAEVYDMYCEAVLPGEKDATACTYMTSPTLPPRADDCDRRGRFPC